MIYIRKAEMRDAKIVYDLSNDPIVRRVSFNTQEISWENHLDWFGAVIENSQLLMLLGFLGESMETDFVGQVRFNIENGKNAEISVSISAPFRGRGLGRELVEMSIKKFLTVYPRTPIVARIKETNVVSQRFFESCGFSEMEKSSAVQYHESSKHYILHPQSGG